MKANNIDNEENQLRVQQAEQERITAAAAARRRRLKLISVLEVCDQYPFPTRNKTNELVENFLENLGDDIHDMICSSNNDSNNNYRGLDSDRDTEEEVETVIRFFPEVLTRTKQFAWYEGEDDNELITEDLYPIQLLAFTRRDEDDWACNMKAVSFIPLVARLAIELGLFEEQYQGGLLCPDHAGENILENLMRTDQTERHNREHHEPIDDKYLQVLIQLRKLDLLKKEDIRGFTLLIELCVSYYRFSEKRFRFLVEWDPSALTHRNELGYSPLHYAAYNCSSLRGFILVFEAGVSYYPKKRGINLLFRKSDQDDTPFKYACGKFGSEEVLKVVEDTLVRYSSSSNNTPPLNIVEALITAVIDDNVHLDCVYFLLRREPDVLQKLLSLTTPVAATMDSYNNNNDEGNDGNSNVLVTRIMDSSKKRKRE
jgi:hypothetical protein